VGSDQNHELTEIFQEIQVINKAPEEKIVLTGISIDSRKVKKGNLYLAIPGTRVDGHAYIEAAVKNGAAAVAGSYPSRHYRNLPVPYLQIENSRESLAHLTAAWYGYPARKLIIIGVTGTDGKTTTVNLIRQILLSAGFQTGLISTVNAVIGDQTLDTGFEFDMGVVTNITHEHLDFHGDYQGYLDAKAELFRLISVSKKKSAPHTKLAVLNKDDGSYPSLKKVVGDTGVKMIDYGITSAADFQAENIQPDPAGLRFTVERADQRIEFQTSLIGDYNVSNCLAALALCIEGLGIDWQNAVEGIKNLTGIPGRMEYLNLGQKFSAIVDFAHTPNALKRVLTATREITSKRVIVVFGSAGLRDKGKRRLMAEVILQEMAEGMISKGGIEEQGFWRVPDRGEAIRFALQLAKPEDAVLVCGKGHEQSMCFGETEYLWDDRNALLAALSEYLGIDGPDMPYLPTQDQ